MAGALICAVCSSTAPAEARFCPACGSPLPEVEQQPTGVLAAVGAEPAVGTPILIVTRGANAGSRFAIGEGTTMIGRHEDSDIFLDDVTVSRQHAQLLRSPDGIEVQDSGSLNGTYLNDRRIERAPLSEGDRLQVGKYKLLFVLEVA
ncbi:MAG: FHA domain-containing protein [Candidatus Microthrix subdominans]|jgi:pSer/pThr/pTyr-binding forkhead associated (FHA) protein|uniref:FHA domain-containing protein n=1 Tax=Candidatus Neomicrothrix subdominans TaxID=2954438 RepID=A0A936TG16_9ACTN|nr:FHA domain-containing protein [Candidatus Microthrix sp.]MBK9298349.1 FHA domain-containing protein [Candidatus Microthrix subdominans]MBK6309858.1 FHA domain-containing protein [Candidatus Microthrix sp.]MBK6438830.1 FHA domain-containing protein [Candidatus Microthrix sp.]MBK6968249.1 FHA domain-containing protein [Candidatus Microthrix sp.]MBK9559767.1 FHA domain-containing protein [Candidatus Microthrix sp.]